MKRLHLLATIVTWLAYVPAQAAPHSFFIASDIKSGRGNFQNNLDSMVRFDPGAAALFVVGDITSDGEPGQWDDFMQALVNGAPDPSVPDDPNGIPRQSIFRTDVDSFGPYIRFVGAVGNHDVHVSDWLTQWHKYLPGQADIGHQGTYFSLVKDNAMFFVLDSENDLGAQTDWLRAELETQAARDAVWKFAFFHAPVYPCCVSKSPFDGEAMNWVQMLEDYEFDMVFLADTHTYERTCPMRGGQCAEGGVIYVNSSGAGTGMRDVDPNRSDNASGAGRNETYYCSDILEAYSPSTSWYHFCHFEMDGSQGTLSCFLSDNIEVPYDTITIDKGPVSDPGTGGTDPGTGGSDPGAGGTDPGTGGSDPGTGGTDPGTGGSDPGTEEPGGEGTSPPYEPHELGPTDSRLIGGTGCSAQSVPWWATPWLMLVAATVRRRRAQRKR